MFTVRCHALATIDMERIYMLKATASSVSKSSAVLQLQESLADAKVGARQQCEYEST